MGKPQDEVKKRQGKVLEVTELTSCQAYFNNCCCLACRTTAGSKQGTAIPKLWEEDNLITNNNYSTMIPLWQLKKVGVFWALIFSFCIDLGGELCVLGCIRPDSHPKPNLLLASRSNTNTEFLHSRNTRALQSLLNLLQQRLPEEPRQRQRILRPSRRAIFRPDGTSEARRL